MHPSQLEEDVRPGRTKWKWKQLPLFGKAAKSITVDHVNILALRGSICCSHIRRKVSLDPRMRPASTRAA